VNAARSLAQSCSPGAGNRINEQPEDALSSGSREQLIVQTAPEVPTASEPNGGRYPISHEWLDEQELLVDGVAEVTLQSDQFLDLLTVARNGLRPKALGI
jgi:hypothetical protein